MSGSILSEMRKPDAALIAEFPHADFDKALQYAQRTNSQRRGPMLANANKSYYQAIASSVKYLIRQHMEQQEKEYQEKQQQLEQAQERARLAREERERARANNVFGLLNLPRQPRHYTSRNSAGRKPARTIAHRAIPTEVEPSANLLGINENAKIQISKNLEEVSEKANVAAAEANQAYKSAAQQATLLNQEIRSQINAKRQELRITPGGTNPQLKHWESGMYKTWETMRKPVLELVQQTHKIAESAKAHAAKIKQQALIAKRIAKEIENSRKNLLVFPSREEELSNLFKEIKGGNYTRRHRK